MKVILADLKLLSLLVFFSLFLTLFDKLNLLNIPKTVIQTLTIPVQYGLYQSGNNFTKQFEFIFINRNAAKENLALRKQLGEILTENASLRTKVSDLETFIDQQSTLSPTTYNLTSARVIGQGRYLIIDKGSSDGISVGEVLVYKNNYLGQVKQVSTKTAQIMRAEDPDSKIAVFSQNLEGKARGVLTGQFGSKLLMDKILHQEKISVNDLVFSEGTEGVLPRGLIMGKVISVDEKSNELFKQANLEPVFDINSLSLVFLMQNP